MFRYLYGIFQFRDKAVLIWPHGKELFRFVRRAVTQPSVNMHGFVTKRFKSEKTPTVCKQVLAINSISPDSCPFPVVGRTKAERRGQATL
jgi:hypothetical protein